MRRKRALTRGVALFLLLALTACSQGDAQGQGADAGAGTAGAGTPGAGTAGGGTAGAGTAGAGTAGGGTAGGGIGPVCDGPAPTPRSASGQITLPIELTIGGQPVVIGEASSLPSGPVYQLSLFKLFLTQPVLVDAAGREATGQIVDANGSPLPYGVQLIDAEDASSRSWRIAVANGSYSRLRFGVGVPQPCNSPTYTNLVYPLNPDGEMFWTWGSQFLFVRIEGTVRPSPNEGFSPLVYHLGFDAAFAHVTLKGDLTVADNSAGPTLELDVARMLATDAGGLPEAKHNVPEGWIADNLEDGAFRLR